MGAGPTSVFSRTALLFSPAAWRAGTGARDVSQSFSARRGHSRACWGYNPGTRVSGVGVSLPEGGGMSRVLTGVGGFFSAAHRDHVTGSLHGHTWEVTAWFRRGTDATIRAHRLQGILAQLDHTELPAELAWGEDIAEWIAQRFDDTACVAVDVMRPAERIYARWER